MNESGWQCAVVSVACVAILSTSVSSAGDTPQDLYVAALAREEAVRRPAEPDRPQSPAEQLKAWRAAVVAFDALVRQYPTSGYCDDALWQAGRLSLDAFAKFGEARDRAMGVKLLRLLASEYPSSRFAKRVPTELAGVGGLTSIGRTSPPSATAAVHPTVRVATIRRVDRTILPDAVRITLELDGEVAFRDERIASAPPRVFIDLPSTRAVPALADKVLRFDGDSDVVRQIRFGRHPNQRIRVVLDTAGVSTYSVYALYNPFRLVIDCVRAPVPPSDSRRQALVAALPNRSVLDELTRARSEPSPPLLPQPEASGSPSRDNADRPAGTGAPAVPPRAPAPARGGVPSRGGPYTMARQLGLGVSRIVIDPGHGGHDPGATGKGVSEAELVLDVALRLERLLQKLPGTDVILTRRTDEFVPLQERTVVANREGADLFLSIHANASPLPEARGVETYFLNFASNLSAAAVAARENAASGQTMAALPDIVKAIALNNKLDESRDFATDVQQAMIERLRGANKSLKNLGVKQAPFLVLIGAAMPSVLAEISFVTNPQEAKLLRSSAYRQRIADALFAAIRTYQTSLKSIPQVAHH